MADSNEKLLAELLKKSGNNVCADCGAKNPEWASYNIGIFVCTRCAGVHRSMGAHISKVKHLKLDRWEDSQVTRVREVGNTAARLHYEERVPSCYRRPNQDAPQVLVEQWIRAKYEREEFCHAERQNHYVSGFMEGFLMKRGKEDSRYHPRKFVLSEADGTLKYHVKENKEPKAVLRICELNVAFAPPKTGNQNSLQISFMKDGSTRHIYVYHEEPEVITNWYLAIRCAKLHHLQVAYPGTTESELLCQLTRDFAREGYLWKTGPRHSDAYKKRWFTLDGRKLMYHDDPMDAHPKGEIFLGHASDGFGVKMGVPAGAKDQGFSFTLETPDRSFLLSAQSDDDRSQWISVIQRVIEKPLTPQDVSSQLETQPSQTEDRRAKLLKWKAEKELQKQLEKQKKQPVFRAGIPHHKYNSPIFLHQSLPIVKPTKPSAGIPRITRATAKRIAARKTDNAKSGPVPGSAQNVKKTQKVSKTTTKPKEVETSFAPENHKFKAPEGLPALKLFGHEALGESTGEAAKLPVYFSPCVVTSRGRRAWCKEQLRSIKDEDETSAETRIEVTAQKIDSSCPTTEEELTPSYFKLTTAKEVNRLQILCRHWEVVKNADNLSEDAQLIINQAIGQTNLLISKKIEQFKKLIVDCENGSGDKLVTCQDLQGFWDMVYMQVEDCDSRFAQLIKLQEKNWVEDQPEVTRKKVASKKPAAIKKTAPSKSSSVRDMIRAARKKLIESSKPENSPAIADGKLACITPRNLSQLATIKFDGGFFMVESPKKTVPPRSIRKLTSSQQSKNSAEAQRRRSALSLMKVSQALKPVEIGSDSGTPSVNYCRQTPGRSILKHRGTSESTSRLKESHSKTDLVDDLENPTIDSRLADQSIVTSEDKGHTNIGRKLHFVSDSDSESDQDTESAKTEDKEQHALSPVVNDSVSTKRETRRTRRGVLVEHNDKSCSESSKTEINESETLRTRKKSTVTESQKENETPRLDELPKQRRSTRKSVRFTGAECTACAERTVYPMTPRANRKSRISTGSAKTGTPSIQLESDLISFDTPKDLPPRVRRSSRLQNNRSRHEDA